MLHEALENGRLSARLAGQHAGSKKELATLVLGHSSCSTLDEGEKHLFAWLRANNPVPSQVIVVTTADKAVLVASHRLDWLDCMTSREDLVRKSGIGRGNLDLLALQYREERLSNIKTKIILEIIP